MCIIIITTIKPIVTIIIIIIRIRINSATVAFSTDTQNHRIHVYRQTQNP